MKDIFKEECFKGMPMGNHSFNYYFMPKVYDKVTQGSTNKMNAMVKELEKRNFFMIERTPKGSIVNVKGESYDIRKIGNSGFELTVISMNGNFRYQIRNTQKENGDPISMSGRTAFIIMKSEFKHDGIDIEKYAVKNGKEIKETIPSPHIGLERESLLNCILDNVNHADFHSAYPGALAEKHPEFKKTIARIYSQRHLEGNGERLKIALDASIGYMQSQYCYIDGASYALANLSKEAISGNNEKVENLARELEKAGRVVIGYNTDGIFYQGKPYHGGRDYGKGLGKWENDHINIRIRFKSSGSYEYIENGIYHPVVRGTTALDQVKSRLEWQWGDIYKMGSKIAYNLNDKNIIKMEVGEDE